MDLREDNRKEKEIVELKVDLKKYITEIEKL
jgi:hypothetical protein